MLYVVPTPIGNLKDITFRAVEVLKNVDLILCEDTRTSGILLNHYDIKKELKSYHKFNEKQSLDNIIERLKKGEDIALISDAGMPGISDPGNILIKEIIDQRLEYTVLPGANAVIPAFVFSGFNAPFTFVGFLPDKKGERISVLESLKDIPSCLIFYISPYKLEKIIQDLYFVLDNRKACAVREISKKFEEKFFFSLKDGFKGTIKGEFVLLIEKPIVDNKLNKLSIEEHFDYYINLGQTKTDAMKSVAKDRGVSKSDIYKKLIKK